MIVIIGISRQPKQQSDRRGGDRMTATEATNIIIKLTAEGWSAEKINEFIVFIETHRPSEDEAMNILKKTE